MNKQVIIQSIWTIIALILFNILMYMMIKSNNHIASSSTLYWMSGAFTSGVIMNTLYEFKLLKIKEKLNI